MGVAIPAPNSTTKVTEPPLSSIKRVNSATMTTENKNSTQMSTENTNSGTNVAQNLHLPISSQLNCIPGRTIPPSSGSGVSRRSVTVNLPGCLAAPFLNRSKSGEVNVKLKTNLGNVIEGRIVKMTPIMPNTHQNPQILKNMDSANLVAEEETIPKVPSSNPNKSMEIPWIPIPTNPKQMLTVQNPLVRSDMPLNSKICAANSQTLKQNPQTTTQNPIILKRIASISGPIVNIPNTENVPKLQLVSIPQISTIPRMSAPLLQVGSQNKQIIVHNFPKIQSQQPNQLAPTIRLVQPANSEINSTQITQILSIPSNLAVNLPIPVTTTKPTSANFPISEPVLSKATNSQIYTTNSQISKQNSQILNQNPQISAPNPTTSTSTRPTPHLLQDLKQNNPIIPNCENTEPPNSPNSSTDRGHVCVICGPIPDPANNKRSLRLITKMFAKRDINSRSCEGIDLSYNPNVYDVIDWLGVFLSQGLEGVRSLPHKGRSMLESPLGIVKSGPEQPDPRRLCKECESAVKSSYVGLRHILKRLHAKGAVYEKFLAIKQKKVPTEPKTKTIGVQTIDNNKKKRKAKKEREPSLPVKKVILSMASSKRKSKTLHSTISKLVSEEIKNFMKNDDSCLKKYYDEDGFIPPNELMAKEVGKSCPLIKKVMEGLFKQTRGKEEWTRPMSAAFCIAANSNNVRMNALQKTVALACFRVGVPKTMYVFLHGMGLSSSWPGTNRGLFEIKQPETETSAPNHNVSEINEEHMDVDTTDNKSDIVPEIRQKQIIVEAEINPLVIQSTVPADDDLLIVGRNLPRRRLWPYRNVATDSAGKKFKVQGTLPKKKKRNNKNIENLQNPENSISKPQDRHQSAEELRKALFNQRLDNHLKKLKGKGKLKSVAKKRRTDAT